MTREELETLTNEELIDELDYCGYDSYYDKYRADIVAEIKKRMREPVLDKVRVEIDDLTYYWCEVNPRSVIDDVLEIIDKYKAENVSNDEKDIYLNGYSDAMKEHNIFIKNVKEYMDNYDYIKAKERYNN